ncbi:hypothetical protein [Desulfopila inferna]|uniref:hypothetical protein n=1 Tax=Desulfopila inferna TaxID=468528 RepID=UPI001962E643|nr:hypothetical protein [Desulfopila inferna]MBM9603567.1 hypothetical protein [Desulfopila inferna]
MVQEKSFPDQVKELKEIIKQLRDDFPPEVIEQTAARLENLNYAPSVITPNEKFLRLDKQGMLDEVDRILKMPEEEACALAPGNTAKCEDLRLQFIKVLLFYYEKLILLRKDDADAWDEVDELYVHD